MYGWIWKWKYTETCIYI